MSVSRGRIGSGGLTTPCLPRLYVHVLISYVYFSIVLFVIYRELLYYIAIRQAYMHSDLYASRLSARTLMLTNVPAKYAGETELKAVFGGVGVVEAVWMTRSNPKLRRLVAQRHAVAMKLEAAEVALIRRADRQRRRRCRADKTAGSSARWWRCWQGSSEPKRPTHRVKWGRKVDTIDWCRAKLAERNAQVDELQARHLRGEAGKGYDCRPVATQTAGGRGRADGGSGAGQTLPSSPSPPSRQRSRLCGWSSTT